MKYIVTLRAVAFVETTVEVDAKSKDAAEAAAIDVANEGDVVWSYDGLDGDTEISATEVRKG
jgi:hypothetical protein